MGGGGGVGGTGLYDPFIAYCKGTREMFGINVQEQGIYLPATGTLARKCKEQGRK